MLSRECGADGRRLSGLGAFAGVDGLIDAGWLAGWWMDGRVKRWRVPACLLACVTTCVHMWILSLLAA
jgi:hypothetical protein